MDKPFIVAGEPGIRALPRWLKGKRYNSWTWPHEDRNGNPFIGLCWDHKPDSDWGKSDKVGIVLVKSKDHFVQALDVVKRCAK